MKQFWYLSFATNRDFLGGCVVKAADPAAAIERANDLGINPGGQVLGIPMGKSSGIFPADRLISKEEIASMGGYRRLGDVSKEERKKLRAFRVCEDCNQSER